MKRQRLVILLFILISLIDAKLIMVNRKAHSELERRQNVPNHVLTSMKDIAETIKNNGEILWEDEINEKAGEGRRQARQKIRAERVYTLMALDALTIRITNEARQKAIQGRNVCRPFVDMANGHHNGMISMVRDELHKIAERRVKAKSPQFMRNIQEGKESKAKACENINDFIHHLDTSGFDDETKQAYQAYLHAVDDFLSIYQNGEAGYEEKKSAQDKASQLGKELSAQLKSTYLNHGYNQGIQKNEIYRNALDDLLARIRLQAEINQSGFTPQPEDRSGDSYRPALPENMIRHEP